MYLGIDIGGTNIKSGVLRGERELFDKRNTKTASAVNPDELIKIISDLIIDSSKTHTDLKAVGIGVPGVVNNGKVISAPHLQGFRNIAFLKELQKKVEFPIYMDNDANAAALAELHLGEGKNLDNFLYVTLGTGIGGAIIINREIFRGSSGGAGEIGHLIIEASAMEQTEVYRTGVLEEYVGSRQIIRIARGLSEKYPDSPANVIEDLDVQHISELADKDDTLCIETLESAGHLIGLGVASALNLLDLRTVIIGGGVSQASFHLFDSLIHTVKRRSLPSVANNFDIKLAEFVEETGIYGACILAKHSHKE